MHPPSIPTRFQTFHYDDREEKGFNSTATRFDKRMVGVFPVLLGIGEDSDYVFVLSYLLLCFG